MDRYDKSCGNQSNNSFLRVSDMHIVKKWQVNIPHIKELYDVGFDDAAIDSLNRVYICDSHNNRVYRISNTAEEIVSFDINNISDSNIRIAVMPDSVFFIADISASLIMRYDETGMQTGDFGLSDIICLCTGSDYLLYVLAMQNKVLCINIYDQLGSLINTIPVDIETKHIDSILMNIDTDSDGCIYLNYGIYPYGIWKIQPDGNTEYLSIREIDHPESAVLVADMSVNKQNNDIWFLLAYRQDGRQIADVYFPNDERLITLPLPASDQLYGLICVNDRFVYLMDTETGADSGNVVCYEIK